MKDIVILGAGGLAREVAFLIDDINRISPEWRIIGFAVPDSRQLGEIVGKHAIAHTEDELMQKSVAVAIGVGSPAAREKIAKRLVGQTGLSFPNLIHPGTVIDTERVKMGMGNIICAGNIFTTDIKIGSFNLFNLNCTYGHDIEIGSYCLFNPGINLSGGVKIGSGCTISTGVTIVQYLKIGDYVSIGPGSLVRKDVPAGITVAGVPARPVPFSADQGKGQ